MSYNKKYMEIAAKEAHSNNQTNEGGPFGCVIVKDDKIVATGHNKVLVNNDPTAHGEVTAIRNAGQELGTFDLSGCELYTSSEPCPMCLSAIIWANIKTVYYGNTAVDAANIGFRDDYIYKFIEGGTTDKSVMDLQQHDRDLTIKSFEEFAADQDKTIY
ncbi:nucleoside deaminase [Holzapfeliella floricola]|uniref:Guanine deaminase n=2 Tax=Holzapfeliella TaxID=2767883 RepID=A0A0R2DU20_9LACO|nr:nucleoside deaminase [Holzapfeliella floricola]KRN03540.1 guanine deaminase [Holzapfeliella floricola DSM 23037 = JCM 16512]